jgi:hypothetical protein
MVATIVLVAHQLLDVQQALLDLSQELIAIAQLAVDGRNLGAAWLVGGQRQRVAAVDHT